MFGWFWKIISKRAVEPIKPKFMPVAKPEVKQIPLKPNQYYQGVFAKKHIVLHHTAGGSAASSIAFWASTPEHIATPYVIDRDGIIYECFDPKYWAYSLGVKGQTALEKATIAIEICSYGALTLKDGKYFTYTNKEIAPDKVVKLESKFRGFQYWEAYSPEQIASLKLLIHYLMDKFKIPKQPDIAKFIEYQNPAKLPPGIYSHTTVRKDKIDVFPQPSLVEMINNL